MERRLFFICTATVRDQTPFFPLTALAPDPTYRRCQTEMVMYDYEGLGFIVIAERKGPYRQDHDYVPPEGEPYPYNFVGDQFVSTYLHGPLGPIERTEEMVDADVSNNRHYYYLRDASGGHVGLIVDDDGDAATPGHPAYQTYDAFGNAMGRTVAESGSLAWRGGEGSMTDREANLVYMQSRHYDPDLGRFLQADTLRLASLTTQGMNRYIYTENDPVNRSDPTGTAWLDAIGLIVAGVTIIALAVALFGATPLLGLALVAGLFFMAAGILTGATAIFFGLSLLPFLSAADRCTLLQQAQYTASAAGFSGAAGFAFSSRMGMAERLLGYVVGLTEAVLAAEGF